MNYYTIAFPGEFGQHVQETWSEDQIMKSYFGYWLKQMLKKHGAPCGATMNRENCIADWCDLHWAVKTDKFGNKI